MDEIKQFEEFELKYKPNTQININDLDHMTNFLYSINTPFQITYETCSGTSPDDFINIVTFSEKGAYFSQEMVSIHNHIFHTTRGHYHDYYEILIVLEGGIRQQIEGNDYFYTAGSCCLINRNICHNETFEEKCRILFVGLSPSFCAQLLSSCDHSFFSSEKIIKDTSLYKFIKHDLLNPDAKTYLDFIPAMSNVHVLSQFHDLSETLLAELLHPHFGSTFLVEACLCNILYELSSEAFHCTTVDLSDSSDRLLFSRIEHLLEENNGRLSRKELSNALNYSGDYINRIVNKYAGVCLHDFSMQICLKRAAFLLRAGNESISDIAAELGFSNRTYFYKLFHDMYGMTPKEYRKHAVLHEN